MEKNANTNVPDNKYGGTFEFYFYGVTGQRLLTMAVAYGEDGNIAVNYPAATETAVYFGGKLISKNGVTIVTDRLGSVRANSNGERLNYWPWGEERGTSTDRREKFATYFRDAAGQDYAEQRYYDNGKGRFWSPDPGGVKTAKPGDPGSWNRYSYVGGDPLNRIDPAGTTWICVGWSDDLSCFDNGDGSDQPGVGGGGGQGPKERPKGIDPPVVTPSLGGVATSKQKKLFQSAARVAESKLRKSGSPCASDFGADALKIFDSATYTYDVVFARDANGSPTAKPDQQVYAQTNPGSQSVVINMVGYFFDIAPTPIQGTDYAVRHDMGTGLSQTDFDAFVLLHELGHLTGVLGDDWKDPSLADAFNAKILNDCFGVAGWKPPNEP